MKKCILTLLLALPLAGAVLPAAAHEPLRDRGDRIEHGLDRRADPSERHFDRGSEEGGVGKGGRSGGSRFH